MAIHLTPAGTITREQTLKPTRRLPVAASTTLTKGEVVTLDAGGDLITAPTTQVVNREYYVALETVVNGGADGAVDCPCAVRGHFVTVVADGAIVSGARIKCSGSTAGQVVAFVPGTDDNNLAIGVYWGKESGVVSKSGTTPFLESYTDTEAFLPADAADGDIIEIEVGV